MADAAPQKRTCGICGRPLSQYNKNDFCNGHPPEEILAYNQKKEESVRDNRTLRSFMEEFHGEKTDDKAFVAKAKRAKGTRKVKASPSQTPHHNECTRLVRIAARKFHVSIKSIESLASPSQARDILCYVMETELKMDMEEIQKFFGYGVLYTVREAVKRVRDELIDNEKIILAVDIVLGEYKIQIKEDSN